MAAKGNGSDNFQWPVGIFVPDDGLSVYVADSTNHRISVWRRTTAASTDWDFQTTFGTEGTGLGQLKDPFDVAVSRDELTAWVADSSNDRISIWKRKSKSSKVWVNTKTFGTFGSEANQFKNPRGIAVAKDGKTALRQRLRQPPDLGLDLLVSEVRVMIADASRRPSPAQSGRLPRPAPALTALPRRGVVRAGLGALAASALGLGSQSDQTTAGKRRKPPYVFDRQWGSQGTGNGQFMHPIGIARAPSNGDIYIADTNNSRIQRFSSAGVFQTAWGGEGSADGQFMAPRGVAVDPETGAVFVADLFNHRIQVFLASGRLIAVWGNPGSAAPVGRPYGIAVSPTNGDVYITDITNSRVLRYTTSGTFVDLLGDFGTGNGQFNSPKGIAISPKTGDVYVVDSGNYRIQRFSADGDFLGKWGRRGRDKGEFGSNGHRSRGGRRRRQRRRLRHRLPERPHPALQRQWSLRDQVGQDRRRSGGT